MSLHYNTPINLELFRSITTRKQGVFLLHIPKKQREYILSQLTKQEIVKLLPFLDPSQATDILQLIYDKEKRESIIVELNEQLKEKVGFLFGFTPNIAAGMMDLNYVQVTSETTFQSVRRRLAQYERRTGKIPSILVVNDGKLIGELPHKVFILYPNTRIKKISSYIRKLPTIHYSQTTGKVLEKLHHHPHKRMVVLDDNNCIIGIIYSDDIIRLMQKEAANRLYDFAGVHDEEDIFDSIKTKVRRRYRWLMINLATAYMAAGVISLFSDTLSQFVFLAAYMPIIAGMGGNAATQTLAVTVRGITLGEITFKNSLPALRNEVGAGLVNGAINGVIVALIALLWNQSPMLGAVTGTAMVINLIIAGFFGTVIPLFMKKIKKDPATSATIFITTATDVFGFLTFLGLATLLLT